MEAEEDDAPEVCLDSRWGGGEVSRTVSKSDSVMLVSGSVVVVVTAMVGSDSRTKVSHPVMKNTR